MERGLAGGVAAADDDHVLVPAALGVGRHRGVVDAGAAEAVDALGLELAPAGAGGHHHRAGEHVLAVVEVDAHAAPRVRRPSRRRGESSTARRRSVVPAASRCGSARCRRSRSESRGSSRSACWSPPDRRAPRPRPRTSAAPPSRRRPRPPDRPARRRARPGRSARRRPRRADRSDRATCAADGLRITLVAWTSTGVSDARDVEPLEHRGALLVGVDVEQAHRQQVALEQIAHLEGAPRSAWRDQPHHAVPLGLVPCAPRQQRARRCARRTRASARPSSRSSARSNSMTSVGSTATQALIVGSPVNDGDVADEGAAVGLGDVDVLAGLAIDELDEPALDHEERRVADGVLVEDLTGREASAAAHACPATRAWRPTAGGTAPRPRGRGTARCESPRVVAIARGYRCSDNPGAPERRRRVCVLEGVIARPVERQHLEPIAVVDRHGNVEVGDVVHGVVAIVDLAWEIERLAQGGRSSSAP